MLYVDERARVNTDVTQDESALAALSSEHPEARDASGPAVSNLYCLIHFYRSPYTRFVLLLVQTTDRSRFISDCISQAALTIFFSIYVLDEIDDNLKGQEVVLIIWFTALLVEEARQLVSMGKVWHSYFADPWNRLDILILLLYFLGLMIRVSDLSSMATKVCHFSMVFDSHRVSGQR